MDDLAAEPFDSFDQLWLHLNGAAPTRSITTEDAEFLFFTMRMYREGRWEPAHYGSEPDGLQDAIRWALSEVSGNSADRERFAFAVATLNAINPDGSRSSSVGPLASPTVQDMQRLWSGVRTTQREYAATHARAVSLSAHFEDQADPGRISRHEWLDSYAWRLLDLGYALALRAALGDSITNRDLLRALVDMPEADLLFTWTGSYAARDISACEAQGVRALTATLVAWWAAHVDPDAVTAARQLPAFNDTVLFIAGAIEGEGHEFSERALLAAAHVAESFGRG